MVELIRRFTWNFFRLENEHLNNCGQFRAVRDISIAPITTGINFTLIHSKLSKESGIRSRRKTTAWQTIVEEENTETTDDVTMDDLESNTADSVDTQMSTCDTAVILEVNEINATVKDVVSLLEPSKSV